ncbi:MAG: NAD(P)H-dependent oxidoreductase [Gammaproteobacteria bacterium]|nr:NAD(P)H-dependent oxidoreductase [Gammaproteobacteria bacterium]NNJ90569.1 NAD(P)H-dependent oxidoreductase [Gammaproteobacteria bacterium]
MKISIISGSHRNPSQSEKIGRYIEKSLANEFENIEPWLYSLADNPLPLWDQSIWEQDEDWEKRLAPLKQQLSESDAFVIIAPEWHGQVPAGLKNFFLMFNRFELGHKPAYIIAVSSSTGGAYPVAELRMSSYKNNRLCYIPEHLIVRDCEKVFNDNEQDNDADSDGYYKSRLNWGLDILIGYGKALKSMRDTTKIHHDDFGNGM